MQTEIFRRDRWKAIGHLYSSHFETTAPSVCVLSPHYSPAYQPVAAVTASPHHRRGFNPEVKLVKPLFGSHQSVRQLNDLSSKVCSIAEFTD